MGGIRKVIAVSGFLCLAGTDAVLAKVSAPQFQSHMVLQRDLPIPVWGEAGPGETVTVRLDRQSQSATAGADGKWSLTLPAKAAGGPLRMTITGQDSLVLEDVLVGDVWVLGGQSNMAFTIEEHNDALKDSARKTGDLPQLRRVRTIVAAGYTKYNAPWTVTDPQTAMQVSATGFFFGREIIQTQDVAIGFIDVSIGSTDIERWLDSSDYFLKEVARYLPHRIRGILWYQGENNIGYFPQYYQARFQALINGWRRAWGQGDVPFLYAQLASAGSALQSTPEGDSKWPTIREAQRLALSLPNTAMTVFLDPTDNDIHPNQKNVIGHRMALAARALAYKESNLVYSGPLYHSHIVQGSTLRLRFTHVGGGLVAQGGGLKGFALAGADNKWSWAEAQIKGDTVVLSSASVPNPVKARYAWASNPLFSLANKEGLQASPFQTEGPQVQPTAVRGSTARRDGWTKGSGSAAGDGRNLLGRRVGENRHIMLQSRHGQGKVK